MIALSSVQNPQFWPFFVLDNAPLKFSESWPGPGAVAESCCFAWDESATADSKLFYVAKRRVLVTRPCGPDGGRRAEVQDAQQGKGRGEIVAYHGTLEEACQRERFRDRGQSEEAAC